MPLYRVNESGRFLPFEETPFPDLERVLEDWIEANPHLLLQGETVAFIARQPRTQHGKFLDLLGVDESGACVIVELKRGETPRDVVAQALEYAAWVEALTLEQLDEMARNYALIRGIDASNVADMYHFAFTATGDDEAADTFDADLITFNNRQRLIIIAERFSGEVEQTLRYLRTRLGIDITGLQFGVHRAGIDTIIQTNVVVGRERSNLAASTTRASRSSLSAEQDTDEMALEKVQTAFLRSVVTGVEEWLLSLGNPDLSFKRGTAKSERRFIKVRGRNIVTYYHAREWIFCWLGTNSMRGEMDFLRRRLSKQNEVRESDAHTIRFHIATDDDLAVLKQVVLARATDTPLA